MKKTKNAIIALAIFASLAALTPAGGTKPPLGPASPQVSQTINAPTGWTVPVNISNTTYMDRNPVAVVDAQGKLYVTWVGWPGSYGAGGARYIMYNTNRTGQWPAATNLNPVYYDAIDDTGFPTIAVTSTGSNVVIAYHDADYSVGYMQVFFRECVNGTWNSGPLNFSEVPTNPCEYPCLGVSPLDNTIFGIFMVDNGRPFDFAMKYRDGGTGAVVGSDYINVAFGRFSKYLYLTKIFAFDPTGTAHLVFTNHTQAWYSKNPTPKNFQSWTTEVNLSGGTGLTDTDPRIAVDGAGDAYVVWQAMQGNGPDIFFRRTINGVWQDTVNISQTTGDSDSPTIAVNPTTKEVYVAWMENVNGNTEIYLKTAAPSGTTLNWGDTVNFTNTSSADGEPWLVCESNGNLHLFWVENVGGNYEILYSFKQRFIPKPKAPLSPAIETTLDGTGAKKINKITWLVNPENANVPLQNYRIYRKLAGTEDATFALLASVSPTLLLYEDTGLDVKKNYSYRLTAVSQNADESDPSGNVTSTKTFEFPPQNPALQTSTRRFRLLFYEKMEKVNTITFTNNPLNVDNDVSGYEIYRKRVEDGNDQFALLATLDTTTFSYQYIISPPDPITQKYAYAVKTTFSYGQKSAFSVIVIEN
ncbi:MAG: hypothetical protein ABSF88_08210 [Candidatus Aminicenantales bacterium]